MIIAADYGTVVSLCMINNKKYFSFSFSNLLVSNPLSAEAISVSWSITVQPSETIGVTDMLIMNCPLCN